MNTKREMIAKKDTVSVSMQCELVSLTKSSLYYKPVPYSDSELNMFNEIDAVYTDFPYYGHRKIWKELNKRGFLIGRDRTLSYMRMLGIEPFYPKPNTSKGNKQHKKYPYLLRGRVIDRPNQVWATDITYIRMEKGFCYLVAIIDWHSRCILSYKLSTTLDTAFCIDALNEALATYPAPEIFNTDQGCQFTSDDFTKILLEKKIQISMDGKGRAQDNIIIERFWRSLKHEDIYLREYRSMAELKMGIAKYMITYNHIRLHESLAYETPASLYGIQIKEVNTLNLVQFIKRSQLQKIAV